MCGDKDRLWRLLASIAQVAGPFLSFGYYGWVVALVFLFLPKVLPLLPFEKSPIGSGLLLSSSLTIALTASCLRGDRVL